MTLLEPEFELKNLKRYPIRKNELLQAWDSADELMINHMSGLDLSRKRIVVLNDQFGALSCALSRFDVTTYTDSYISSKGLELNSNNKLHSLNDLGSLSGIYDYALIQIPKNLSFFEDMLCHLSQHLGPESQVLWLAKVRGEGLKVESFPPSGRSFVGGASGFERVR